MTKRTNRRCRAVSLAVVLSAWISPGAEAWSLEGRQEAGPKTDHQVDQAAGWPQTFDYDDGSTVVLYQPQGRSWEENERLEAIAAVAYRQASADSPELGALHFRARAEVDVQERLVRLADLSVVQAHFPSMAGADRSRLGEQLQQLLPDQDIVMSLDHFLAALERSETSLAAPVLRPDPPQMFYSDHQAILVQYDGEPILSPIEKSPLQFVVNTNWDVLYDEKSDRYYLLYEGGWLAAPEATGPWSILDGKLPKAFKKLPKKDANFEEVRTHVPGSNLQLWQLPVVFVATEPSELILVDGEPALRPISGTQLLWVTNTESDLFLSTADRHFYYLVSGRWFRGQNLEGEWSFASDDLPADFLEIPPDHEKASVLTSVPGSKEAQEAVILAHIPQQAQVERADIQAPTVVYQGEPVFRPIDGVPVAYAINTAADVLQVGDLYYLCHQGVWFVATTAQGAWQLADEVPPAIYEIPASEPVHNVTYVQVYDSTPTTVTYGYSSGYLGVYFGWGVMVYGSGWYYPPYYFPGYRPIYYPFPPSYGFSAWYNPNTGTYGRGASVYGPYGGMGRAAAYNPTTGSYARGGAAWGPYQARGWAEAYNPRSGTYARTRQGANPYASWGATGVTRGDDWLRTARYSDERGTVRKFETSGGRGGTFVSDGNNLYAGKDGNVYRRDGSGGWSKYDNGDWSQVPSERARTQEGGRASVPADRASGGRDGARGGEVPRNWGSAGGTRSPSPSTIQQLDVDSLGRSRGSTRSANYDAWRGGGGYGGRGGGGVRRGGRR